MKMIVGGAFQGKRTYAEALYPEITWVDGRSCSIEDLSEYEGIDCFHELIRRLLEEDKLAKIEELNSDVVIISDEIGCGLVPIERFQREYRETTGRICTRLAAQSERVDRVICGVGKMIKGKE